MGNFGEAMPTQVPQGQDKMQLTPQEQAFMARANMTPEQLAQYNRWKKLDQELGGDQAL